MVVAAMALSVSLVVSTVATVVQAGALRVPSEVGPAWAGGTAAVEATAVAWQERAVGVAALRAEARLAAA